MCRCDTDAPAGIAKYEKRLLLRCTHHFKSDRTNNMDHTRTVRIWDLLRIA